MRTFTLTAYAAVTAGISAASALAQDGTVSEPATFTSMFTAMATPDMVFNADSVPTPGEAGATGTFNYRITNADEIICYDITLRGVTAPFQSPAKTATHIHQAAPGKAGPPRIALPNPQDTGHGALRSEGLLRAAFRPIELARRETAERLAAHAVLVPVRGSTRISSIADRNAFNP